MIHFTIPFITFLAILAGVTFVVGLRDQKGILYTLQMFGTIIVFMFAFAYVQDGDPPILSTIAYFMFISALMFVALLLGSWLREVREAKRKNKK